MEITPGFIYLVATLENLKSALPRLAGSAVVLSFASFSWAYLVAETVRNRETSLKIAKISLVALLGAILLNVFIPSGKTLAAMYILPPIVNSEAVQKLPSELTDLAIEWLRELKPNKENKE